MFGRKKIKVGLALGGGGARGFAHIGVFKALQQHNISVDFVAGTSAGAVAGAMFCAGVSVEEFVAKSKTLTKKDILTSRIPLMPSKTEGIEKLMIDTLGDIEYKDLKLPFCAVAVDMKTGEEVHFTNGNIAKTVAGSCAVPGVFLPVEYKDYLLFDGGLLNNIPANVPKLFGCDVVIAVDINSKRGQGTNSVKYIDLLVSSISIMMKSNTLKGYINADVMIKPDAKRFSSSKLDGSIDDLVEVGYLATIEKIDEIKELIGQKPKNSKFFSQRKARASNFKSLKNNNWYIL